MNIGSETEVLARLHFLGKKKWNVSTKVQRFPKGKIQGMAEDKVSNEAR